MALIDSNYVALKNLNHLPGSPYIVGDEVSGSDFTDDDHIQYYLANNLVAPATASADSPIVLGPVATGVAATDTAALNAALAADARVVLPSGNYVINSPLLIHNLSSLSGQGRTTKITLADNAVCDMLKFSATTGVFDKIEIYGIWFDGNKSHQPSPCNGIVLDSTGHTLGPSGDSQFRLRDLYITNVNGDGIKLKCSTDVIEQRQTHILDCEIYYAQGHGILIDGPTDNILHGTTVGEPGLAGFRLTNTANNRLTNCKSFYGGSVATGSWGGFDINAARNSFVSCESQDHYGHGFWLRGSHNVLSGCIADCNGRGGFEAAGYRIDSERNNVQGLAANYQNQQEYAVWIESGMNRVELTSTQDMNMRYVRMDPSYATNTVVINGQGRQKNITYAASVTPDPYDCTVHRITLTGNITIANPSSDNRHPGIELEFEFTQDGTGSRTVTWGSDFSVTWTITPTASATSVIRFRWNGTKWVPIASFP